MVCIKRGCPLRKGRREGRWKTAVILIPFFHLLIPSSRLYILFSSVNISKIGRFGPDNQYCLILKERGREGYIKDIQENVYFNLIDVGGNKEKRNSLNIINIEKWMETLKLSVLSRIPSICRENYPRSSNLA